MAERNSEGKGSFPLNLQTLLVLLTLASSVLLVSQKLTSMRPAASVGIGRASLGEQNVEARLWEDPFKTPERYSKGEGKLETAPKFTELLDRIKARRDKCKDGVILPVMIPGGPYSEDQESRIRTRFAIVSALSQSGYVSKNPEHLGSVTLWWPTTKALKDLMGKVVADTPASWKKLYTEPSGDKTSTDDKTPPRRDLRYEWYRLRDFYPRSPGSAPDRTADIDCPYVLVLWLNERDFEDEPLLRLPWMLGAIMAVEPETKGAARLALIGPGLSSTLRAMLPSWETEEVLLMGEPSQLGKPCQLQLERNITSILNHIEIYSATTTAMEEVLVNKGTATATAMAEISTQKCTNDSSASSHKSVGEALKKIGFKSFRSFVATDDQLAKEILYELGLRGVDFTKVNEKVNKPDAWVNHLVLLSEWDTFYARMLSLTYAAELAILQDTQVKNRRVLKTREIGRTPLLRNQWDRELNRDNISVQLNTLKNRAEFIKQHRNAEISFPSNMHWFVYLRGLDGQTTGNDSGSARGSGSEDAPRTSPTSLEDLRKWTPDANKAEGPAQFDYLSRLGEQLVALGEQLSKDGGRIKAIGVVGSDVYDTLLILQALRDRFPHVFFFTMGLDARFWHPRQRSWSRNLIVTSSYGLSLHPKLQQSVPFFRDSWQTAQYAATLAALKHLALPLLTVIPPRRFEIGSHGAVDLSVADSPLHPSLARNITPSTCVVIVIVCAMTALLLTIFCGPLRRLTWEASQSQAGTLRYREEDVGGIEGSLTLVSRLQKLAQAQQDQLAQWLMEEFKRITLSVSFQWAHTDARQQEEQSVGESPKQNYTILLEKIEKAKQSSDDEKAKAKDLQELERCKEELLRVFLDFLNRLLHRNTCHPGETINQTSLLLEKSKDEWRSWWLASHVPDPKRDESPQQLRLGRSILDELLRKLVEEPDKSGVSVEQGMQKDIQEEAQVARDASLELYDLRRRWIWLTRILAPAIVLLAIGLSVLIWYDSKPNTPGEPFSLTTGTSAWPAEILRFAAFALAISLSFQSYQSLQTMMFELTRRFRLPLDGQKPQRLSAKIVDLWGCLKYRLPTIRHRLNRAFRLPAPPEPGAVVDASKLWKEFQQHSIFSSSVWRILGLLGLYFLFCLGVFFLGPSELLRPLRGPWARGSDIIILFVAVVSFLFLTFMIIDAVRLCQWFIRHLSEVPTEYPLAATKHFSRLRGLVDMRYLDEWIDLQLIADLTEHVSRLVYYPFIVFLLLLLARNYWWDHWPWSWSLIIIFVGNLTLAASSVVILQTAARKAKHEAEATLEAKVKRLQAAIAASPAANDANQAEKLLEEIRTLRRGAFVPFWENPVLGAILLPSSSVAAFQILMWIVNP